MSLRNMNAQYNETKPREVPGRNLIIGPIHMQSMRHARGRQSNTESEHARVTAERNGR